MQSLKSIFGFGLDRLDVSSNKIIEKEHKVCTAKAIVLFKCQFSSEMITALYSIYHTLLMSFSTKSY